MNAIGRSSHRTKAALLLCSFVCGGGSAFAASFDDAMRILNQLKSAIPPPTAPAAPPANTPAPGPSSTSPVQSGTPPAFGHNNRFSDAEKAYVPEQATTRVAEGARPAKVDVIFGRKFVAGNDVTITNPYLDVQRVFFATLVEMHYAPDGALIVGGNVGLDKEMHALGTGYWRVAPDGAITPMHTRSTNTYGKSPGTQCDAPYTRTHLSPANFAPGLNGSIVKAIKYAVLRIDADGYVRRLAGSPFACEGGGTAPLEGFVDGPADTARFNGLSDVVSDPHGNVWVVDQKGCALRRIAPDGHVTTVLSPEKVLCGNSDAPEDRVGLYHIAWDAVNDELVSAASFPVARPVHTLYNTVWRIRPSGEFRRVLWSKKGGVSPAKHNMDGIWSLAVDPQGRIHLGSAILTRGTASPLAVVRVDEARATVVAVTGGGYGPGTFGQGHDHPLDGPAARVRFHWLKGLAFAPDGTLYMRDEHLVRKLDRSGQVTTWVF